MSKRLFSALLLSTAALLPSCTTTDIPGVQVPDAGNPLIGTWKFDFTAAVVYNAAYAANAGLTEAQQEQTKKLIELSNDSSVTFTRDTITTTAGTTSASMKYKVKSADANGNIIIVNDDGIEASYSVSGDKLSNTVTAYAFVAVYKKQ